MTPIMRVVLPIVGPSLAGIWQVPRLGCLTWLSVPLSDCDCGPRNTARAPR